MAAAIEYLAVPPATGAPSSNMVGAAMAVSRNPLDPRTALPPAANNNAPTPKAPTGTASPMSGPNRRSLWRYWRWPPGTMVEDVVASAIPRSYDHLKVEPQQPWRDSLVVVLAVFTVTGAATSGRGRTLAAIVGIVVGLTMAARAVRVASTPVTSAPVASAPVASAPVGATPVDSALAGPGLCQRRSEAVGWMLIPLCVLGASVLSQRASAGLHEPTVRSVTGWAEVVTDPERLGGGITTIVRVDGVRLVIDGYGHVGKRLQRLSAGDRVWIEGRVRRLSPTRRSRLAFRHVAAGLDVGLIGDPALPRPLARAANRVRSVLARGVTSMPVLERSLFLGLVIGDDRAEPAELIADFRRSGLSHLTAVSGQNIGFLLIALGPLLRRLRPRARWISTIGCIGWFAAMTRFEPSVLRAAVMAGLSATVFWRGWRASPTRLLALAVIALTLIDPLIVRSVGWWLSVGATAGISLLAGPLARRLPGPRWVVEPASASLSAQLGVLPVSILVFHRMPLFGLLSNLLAGPLAGMVMVWGIPAALVGGAVPAVARALVFPSLLATRWVLIVARLGSKVEPDLPAWISGTVHLVLTGAILRRPQRSSTLSSTLSSIPSSTRPNR